ncbi:WD repeat-containing protein 43-like isoform X3 [Bradysia coprophila]|uniref:WD repeat-containing protein 43-like isoform X3 n=1 Tax=Bradysia coprophila TaxID=38358 RepID=UPI00187D7397|nr:WD repeat-containing protein 43-like isoform X3 [Bradysia coprophila]
MGYGSDFSPDGRLFALLDTDGKLKIWNVKDNRLTQEYVPDLHLSQPYTCFVWFTACAGIDGTLYIALGTSEGGVDLYSHAQGKLARKFTGDGHAGAVTAICLHSNTTLYTSGEDSKIVEWSLTKCSSVRYISIGRIVPTCIVSLPLSNTLLLGCKQLHQWSLGEVPEKKATLTGHSADVSSMKVVQFAEREEYVVTTAKNNREIYLWKIGSKKGPKGTFLMEHSASFVSCSVFDRKLIIAAVTQASGGPNGGVVHLFIIKDISDIGKKQNPKVTLAVAFDSGKIGSIPIVAATTSFSQPHSSNILIGYGNLPTLSFEDVHYNPNEKKQILDREDPRLSRHEKTKEIFKTIVPNTNNTVHNPGPAKKTKGDRKPEISLQERMSNLSTSQSDDDKGHSLVETLKQALHNHDAANIRTVLATKDENMIRSTLKRLPAHYVPSLIDELTLLTHKKTANVQVAVRWLKLLLQIHASQLMALGKDELRDRFGALLGIIQNRTNCLVQLTTLSGRLDFLLNQIKRNTDDDPIFNHENLLVYEDESSNDEDSADESGMEYGSQSTDVDMSDDSSSGSEA